MFAAPANADHATATAAVSLTVGAQGSDGSYEGNVSWTLACGPAGVESNTATVRVLWRDKAGKEHSWRDAEVGPGDTGEDTIPLPPGAEYIARASLVCQGETSNEDTGETTVHRASATADSQTVRTAPWVRGIGAFSSEPCVIRGRPVTSLRARYKGIVQLATNFEPRALMRKPKSSRELRLRFQGGGLPARARPIDRMWRRERIIGAQVKPRRAGTVKVWLEVGGVRSSNTGKFRVAPFRRC
jgi:hypothetical protein